MSNNLIKFLITLLLIAPVSAISATFQVNGQTVKSFAPQNSTFISVDDKNANPMTEELFNKILDRVEEVYTPKFTKFGAVFELQRAWSDGTANAYATQRGKKWIIKMFGGLARHKNMTPDGFALVACHEIGHHLGGFPKYSGWASNEGQSDYFATLKCARFIWDGIDNLSIVKRRLSSDPKPHEDIAKAACIDNFKTAQEQALCTRSALGGLSLARVLASLGRSRTMPQFDTPDTSVTRRTNNRHPKAQCRLDTYFAGALCGMEKSTDVSNKNPDQGVCSRKLGDTVGTRPLCWYKPKK